jgi:hypothetical protein
VQNPVSVPNVNVSIWQMRNHPAAIVALAHGEPAVLKLTW